MPPTKGLKEGYYYLAEPSSVKTILGASITREKSTRKGKNGGTKESRGRGESRSSVAVGLGASKKNGAPSSIEATPARLTECGEEKKPGDRT